MILESTSRPGKTVFLSVKTAAGRQPDRSHRHMVWPLFVILVLLAGLVPVVCADAPIGSFTANVTTGAKPLAVQFIDTSTNGPAKWFWSFGDGSTSAESDPVHLYTIDGVYTVTLTVTNFDGSHSVTKANYITVIKSVAAPEATFVSTGTSGSKPLTVKFIDTSSNAPNSWAWSFGDGGTSAEQNPTHIYVNKGSFTVTLTATNDGGSATVTKGGYITVSEESMAPVASFTATKVSGSTPLTVKFIDTSTNGPTSWVWTYGDGYSDTVQNPTHTYTGKGSYTVTMTATNSIGSSTASKDNYITAKLAEPIASFTANITSGTAPLTVQFNDTSQNAPTSWSWFFSDGDNVAVQNPVHQFTTAGSYTVVLTAKNEAGTNATSKAKYINVSATLIPVVSFSVDKTSGSDPLTVHFTDTSRNSPTSWEWTFGDGSTSTDQNPSHTYYNAGHYSVVLTATNAQGSRTYTSPDAITVTSTTTQTTATPEVTEVTPADTPAATATETPVPSVTVSAGSSSGWLLPLLLILAVVAIIVILVLRRRPPRGHHGSRGRDL
jgi:PKD repeat protein